MLTDSGSFSHIGKFSGLLELLKRLRAVTVTDHSGLDLIRAAQAEATAGARRPGMRIPAQRRRQATFGRRGAEYGAPGHFPRTRRRDDRRRRAPALSGRPDRQMSPTTEGLRRGPRGGR